MPGPFRLHLLPPAEKVLALVLEQGATPSPAAARRRRRHPPPAPALPLPPFALPCVSGYTAYMLKHGLNKRDGRLRKLGFAVNEYLAEGGQLERSQSSLCAEIWPQVVGHWYGRHSRVISLDRKELKVCCDTPALAQQLQFDQETVIARLNERLGGEYIRSLRPASVGRARESYGLQAVESAEGLPPAAELGELTLPEAELTALRAQAARLPEGLAAGWLRAAEGLRRLHSWRQARGYKTCRVCGALYNDLNDRCFACRVDAQPDPRKGSDERLDFGAPPPRRPWETRPRG